MVQGGKVQGEKTLTLYPLPFTFNPPLRNSEVIAYAPEFDPFGKENGIIIAGGGNKGVNTIVVRYIAVENIRHLQLGIGCKLAGDTAFFEQFHAGSLICAGYNFKAKYRFYASGRLHRDVKEALPVFNNSVHEFKILEDEGERWKGIR